MLPGFIITWLVTGVSLFIISRLKVGIEIEDFGKALIAAIIFGLVNAFLGPIARFFSFPIIFITFGLFALVVNAGLFWVASVLSPQVKLRSGCLSAFIGSILLALINWGVFWALGQFGIGV